VAVVALLLVDDLLQFEEEGVVEEAGVFGEGEEEGCGLVEVGVAVDLLFV
jgi:hypothetical protein